jgi:hypothetical protein
MAVDWDRIRREATTNVPPPAHWPPGVKPLSFDGGDLLGVGPDNTLYWDGQRLEVARTVSLSWWQTTFAAMTALGTFLAGIAVILPLFGITKLL